MFKKLNKALKASLFGKPLFFAADSIIFVYPKENLVLMKQSLIIVLIICFALGESFSLIIKQDKKTEKATKLCCNKTCSQKQETGERTPAEQTVLPGVHLLPFSL